MPRTAKKDETQAVPATGGHSKLGVASFIVAVLVVLISFILVIISALIQVKNPSYFDGDSVGVILLGLVVLFATFAALVGLVLGIIALFVKGKNPVFSILGAVFNFLTLIGWILLMIIGSVTG